MGGPGRLSRAVGKALATHAEVADPVIAPGLMTNATAKGKMTLCQSAAD